HRATVLLHRSHPPPPSPPLPLPFSFFSNHPAPPALYTLSLHDALPISSLMPSARRPRERSTMSARSSATRRRKAGSARRRAAVRSEEHTSELQSLTNLVCRLLLEKKKRTTIAEYAGAATQ